jgi:hypothetical protein
MVESSEFRVLGLGIWVWGLGCVLPMSSLTARVEGLRLKVCSGGLGVEGLGLRVWGVGFQGLSRLDDSRCAFCSLCLV